jgi:hypothetical protein
MHKIIFLFCLPVCLFCDSLTFPISLNADKERSVQFKELDPIFTSKVYLNFTGQTFSALQPMPFPAAGISTIIPTNNLSYALELGIGGCIVASKKLYEGCLEVKGQYLYFLSPKKNTSTYLGAGAGISTARLVPIYLSTGMEWGRLDEWSRRLAITATTSPVAMSNYLLNIQSSEDKKTSTFKKFMDDSFLQLTFGISL